MRCLRERKLYRVLYKFYKTNILIIE